MTIGRFILCMAVLCPARTMLGQSPLTVINDTITSANGVHPSGTATITWGRYQNDAVPRQVIFPGTKIVTITNGVVNTSLFPNSVALPPGGCYAVYYNLAGVKSTRYWFVPASGSPVNLNDIEGSLPCQTQSNVLISPAQITGGNAQVGYVIAWNGSYWTAAAPTGGAGGNPGGTNGQLQFNNLGGFGGFTLGGDCTLNRPNITCAMTGGVPFSASATRDTTNAANISTGLLAVSVGGTGSSGLTTGSVPFIGATGVYSQDNMHLFWDSANGRLGIGTNAPSSSLVISGSGLVSSQVVSSSGQAQMALTGATFGQVLNNTGDLLVTNNSGGNLILRAGSSQEFMRGASSLDVLVGGSIDSGYRVDVMASGSVATMRLFDQTPSTGATLLVMEAGAAQSAQPLVQWLDHTSAVLSEIGSDGSIAAVGAGLRTSLIANNLMALGSAGKLAFSNITSWDGGTPDVALARNGIGALEINNLTPGAFRDLKLRSVISSSLSGSGPQCVSVDNTGLLVISGTGPCFTGSTFTPFSTTVSAQTSVSITAVTHARGVTPIATCLDNSTPKNIVSCAYTRDVSGNLVFAFNPPFSGVIEVRQ